MCRIGTCIWHQSHLSARISRLCSLWYIYRALIGLLLTNWTRRLDTEFIFRASIYSLLTDRSVIIAFGFYSVFCPSVSPHILTSIIKLVSVLQFGIRNITPTQASQTSLVLNQNCAAFCSLSDRDMIFFISFCLYTHVICLRLYA